jgi:hypothetical protein
MKNAKIQSYYKCLIYDQFSAKATIVEVKYFFSLEEISVFSTAEIENALS